MALGCDDEPDSKGAAIASKLDLAPAILDCTLSRYSLRVSSMSSSEGASWADVRRQYSDYGKLAYVWIQVLQRDELLAYKNSRGQIQAFWSGVRNFWGLDPYINEISQHQQQVLYLVVRELESQHLGHHPGTGGVCDIPTVERALLSNR